MHRVIWICAVIVSVCVGCTAPASLFDTELSRKVDIDGSPDFEHHHDKWEVWSQDEAEYIKNYQPSSGQQRLIYRPPSAAALDTGGAPIQMHFREVPLSVFTQVLTLLTGENIITHHAVTDKRISIDLNEVPWREALQVAVQVNAMQVRRHNGVIIILPREQLDGKSFGEQTAVAHTDMFKLSYSDPNIIKGVVDSLFADVADGPSLSVDNRTRALLVQGDSEQIKIAAALVRQLDVPIKQVRIEAFIVEAGEDFERSFGTRLGINRIATDDAVRVAGVAAGAPSADGTATLGNNAGLAVNLPLAASHAGLGLLLDSRRLKLELTALENEGKSRIISNPKIFTLDNQEAIIFQGDEVPYFTVSENGTQTQFKEAGIRLAVTPSIVGDNYLMLDIVVNKDTVDTRLANPPITRRQISTKLKIPDGVLVVIGGIYFNTKVDAVARVPVLGSVPILGSLFRRSQKEHDVKELLVFIAPKIIGV